MKAASAAPIPRSSKRVATSITELRLQEPGNDVEDDPRGRESSLASGGNPEREPESEQLQESAALHAPPIGFEL